MGHKQPKSSVTTDNSTAHGLIHQLLIPKASKSMDMRFHWLKCRVAQRLFNVMWRRAKNNRAAFHTKAHPIKHYREQQPNYIFDMLPNQWVGYLVSPPGYYSPCLWGCANHILARYQIWFLPNMVPAKAVFHVELYKVPRGTIQTRYSSLLDRWSIQSLPTNFYLSLCKD